ncbi:MAG TPA: hypothetical protein VG937_37345 [Polyangiaceae bacterium]|jgi:hypothetical protein|nr:hypothetical protein [Polyangiaceae bacterium]
MPTCGARAVLIVTATLEGTATNVARRRVELACGLPEQHEGAHRDVEQGEAWQAPIDEVSMILRHEDESA